jgi:hypothetical protein
LDLKNLTHGNRFHLACGLAPDKQRPCNGNIDGRRCIIIKIILRTGWWESVGSTIWSARLDLPSPHSYIARLRGRARVDIEREFNVSPQF